MSIITVQATGRSRIAETATGRITARDRAESYTRHGAQLAAASRAATRLYAGGYSVSWRQNGQTVGSDGRVMCTFYRGAVTGRALPGGMLPLLGEASVVLDH